MLPLGIRLNNPGNLRTRGTRNRFGGPDPWKGLVGEDPRGFGIFDTMTNGVRAAAKDLRHGFGRGDDTVREIIEEYAPPSENDTEAYIDVVSKGCGVGESEPLSDDQPTIRMLLHAIFHHEQGGDFVDEMDLIAGVARAFG